MAFYYPQDTTAEMGPTSILPGSQHYMVMPTDPENAEQLLCGPAGTVTVVNFDIWHRATANRGNSTRWMLKFLFARMAEPRVPAWDAQDLHWQAPADVPAAEKHRGMWERVWHWHHGEEGRAANGKSTPDAGAIGTLLRDLQSEGVAARRRAADALGRGGPAAREAIPALVAALGDADEPTGLNAAYALGAIGEAAIPALAEALRAEAEPVRRHASYALTTIGAPAIAALIHAMRDQDARVRALAADALGDMGFPARDAVPALRDALRDGDEWVRRQAVDALGTIGPAARDAVPALIDTLRDEKPYVRFNAAFALARLGPAAAEAVPGLERLTRDPDRYARGQATIALRRIGTPEAMEALLRYLETARWCPITDKEHPY
jgi:HEAT repeat protein